MLLVLGLLALTEAAALRWAGVGYTPPRSLTFAAIADLSVSADGRWGASCVRFQCAGTPAEQRIWSEILVHDMQRPERTIRLYVERLDPQDLAISPSGDRIAFATGDQSVYLWRRRTNGDPLRLLARNPDGGFRDLAWSLDDRRLAAAGTKHLYVWRLPSGELLSQIERGSKGRIWIGFESDSQRLLCVASDGQIRLWDAEGSRLVQVLGSAPAHLQDVDWTMNLQRTAFLIRGNAVCVGDLQTGRVHWRSAPYARRDGAVAMSPDGRWVAATEHVCDRANIDVWNARTGERVLALSGHEKAIHGLRFSPDGTLYSWDREGMIIGWNLDLETRQPVWRFLVTNAMIGSMDE
ncbi:MAG: hypothetical protein KY475_21760 [Planctomycetes bacterium]|nr:hypothetical protein [Planctomycetota bacterium]